MTSAQWHRLALGAIGLGAVMRVVWVLGLHPPMDYVYSDMKTYVDTAVRFAQGGALDRYDAFYPPGTHLLLAVPLFIFGTDRTGLWAGAVLWCALSAVTPYAMWRFARYHLTTAAAALTAVLVALWPMHISYAGYFTSETPALAFLVISLWLVAGAASGRDAIGAIRAGILGGAAIANRPALGLNLLVALASAPGATRVRTAAAFGAGAAVILGLVALHNSLATGKPTFLSENAGLTFFIGHCDVLSVETGDSSTGRHFVFAAPPALERGSGRTYKMTSPLVWEQEAFFRMGVDCIRQDGVAHLRTLARGVFDMTLTSKPWPQVEEADHGDRITIVNTLFSAALPFIVVGAIGLIRERRRRRQAAGEAVMLAHLACVLATALLFFGDPRFRTPYDVFALALLAALIAHRLFDRGTETETDANPAPPAVAGESEPEDLRGRSPTAL
jgi:4-amino-4-deoxy-L-arabinose transferase-like glycosyltransferase